MFFCGNSVFLSVSERLFSMKSYNFFIEMSRTFNSFDNFMFKNRLFPIITRNLAEQRATHRTLLFKNPDETNEKQHEANERNETAEKPYIAFDLIHTAASRVFAIVILLEPISFYRKCVSCVLALVLPLFDERCCAQQQHNFI